VPRSSGKAHSITLRHCSCIKGRDKEEGGGLGRMGVEWKGRRAVKENRRERKKKWKFEAPNIVKSCVCVCATGILMEFVRTRQKGLDMVVLNKKHMNSYDLS